ncbi:L,D-transpeptidase family protein [Qiania dongpingensis]|uniref:L,D-TPase catalytic domain-containing protein n=1 Tax=Qiania dongpingensis TaxID=2763669 RepID=A0A7G9G7S9_9FIRM|nr:L,D-transpeptidase family protein [Qiania dongpingensis]QNM06861.1 hypothetical protein H9Q78_07060 [Qiania dongpingensis]
MMRKKYMKCFLFFFLLSFIRWGGMAAAASEEEKSAAQEAAYYSGDIYLPPYTDGGDIVAGMVAEPKTEGMKYQWLYFDFDINTWNVIQDWNSSELVRWIPPKTGNYMLHCYAMAPSGELIEANTLLYYSNEQLHAAGIYMPPYGEGEDIIAGMVIEPELKGIQFQWLFYDFQTGSWNMIQDWKEMNCLRWTPPHSGDYMLHCYAKGPSEDIVSSTTLLNYRYPGFSSANLQVLSVTASSVKAEMEAEPLFDGVQYQWLYYDFAEEGWHSLTDWGSFKNIEWIPEYTGDYLLFCYARSATGDIISDAKLLHADTDMISKMEAAKYTDQIITVVGNGTTSGADLHFFEKSETGWTEIIKTEAQLGENGFSVHTLEGDKTTPLGCYDLGIAFGNKENPGTALEWIDINPYMYWIDDLNSVYYNLLIDSRRVPDGWLSGEHLFDYVPSYNYAVNIDVNPECRKDSTSAIFLHCKGSSNTTLGCVAINEDKMRYLLQLLNPGAKIVMVKSERELMNY